MSSENHEKSDLGNSMGADDSVQDGESGDDQTDTGTRGVRDPKESEYVITLIAVTLSVLFLGLIVTLSCSRPKVREKRKSFVTSILEISFCIRTKLLDICNLC